MINDEPVNATATEPTTPEKRSTSITEDEIKSIAPRQTGGKLEFEKPKDENTAYSPDKYKVSLKVIDPESEAESKLATADLEKRLTPHGTLLNSEHEMSDIDNNDDFEDQV